MPASSYRGILVTTHTLREDCTVVGSFYVVKYTSTACIIANFKISSQRKFLWASIPLLILCREMHAADAKSMKITLYSAPPQSIRSFICCVSHPLFIVFTQPSWHRRGSTKAASTPKACCVVQGDKAVLDAGAQRSGSKSAVNSLGGWAPSGSQCPLLLNEAIYNWTKLSPRADPMQKSVITWSQKEDRCVTSVSWPLAFQ